MISENDLRRFVGPQQRQYEQALREITAGRKRSHWMWYIFPQMRGLGYSSNAHYYGICDLDEAEAYLADSYLGGNLCRICEALLELETDDAYAVFGSPDDMKLQSSMTLFAHAAGGYSVFHEVLDKFYDGRQCRATNRMLGIE